MLGGASATAAYAMGMVSDALSSVAFTTSAIVVSAAGAVVVGFPLLVSANALLFILYVMVSCEYSCTENFIIVGLTISYGRILETSGD